MIFPKIRISELEKDVQQKRESLLHDRHALVESVREEVRPLNFIKNHTKFVLGSVLAVVAAIPFFGRQGKKLSRHFVGYMTNRDTTIKTAMIVGPILIRAAVPLAAHFMESLVKKFFKPTKQETDG